MKIPAGIEILRFLDPRTGCTEVTAKVTTIGSHLMAPDFADLRHAEEWAAEAAVALARQIVEGWDEAVRAAKEKAAP